MVRLIVVRTLVLRRDPRIITREHGPGAALRGYAQKSRIHSPATERFLYEMKAARGDS